MQHNSGVPMFTGEAIAFFLISGFLAGPLFDLFKKRKYLRSAKLSLTYGLLSFLYCVAAGVSLASGWHDPFADATSQELARGSATHGGKGGIIILAIRYWPYVLMALPGYFAYMYLRILFKYRNVKLLK